MIVLYILILIYFNFNSTSIVNVFMLSIEKTKQKKKQVFFAWQTIKITLLVFNGPHMMRTFSLNFKRDFVLKGIFILPRRSTSTHEVTNLKLC